VQGADVEFASDSADASTHFELESGRLDVVYDYTLTAVHSTSRATLHHTPHHIRVRPRLCNIARPLTLLVAIKGADGLALAADSRGTFGDPRGVTAQNDSQQKAHILAPHAAVLAAGSGEVGSLLVQEAINERSSGIDGVTTVMNFLRDKTRTRYAEWFPSVPAIQAPQAAITGQAPTRPDLAFIVAGYELDGEGRGVEPKMYQLQAGTDFSPMLHNYGFAVAGVAQYALYLLNRLYEPDRSVAELTALAVYVITETASQDGKVGGPVNVINITPDQGCEALKDEEVREIVTRNEARSQSLRDSFYERGES
jgi:20S proteasome alpha/beta subunit